MATKEKINSLVEEERQREEVRRRAQQQEVDDVPRSEVHTYPDGSQRVGCPPFPEESPAEEEARLGNREGPGARPMDVPRGMKTSGEPAPNPNAGPLTEDQFKARVSEQLTSDVTSGKDPQTPNPTTSSDKPELRYMTAGDGDGKEKTVLSAEPTPEELEAIAASIEPKGDLEATQAEKEAAVLQVARETRGPVIADTKSAKKK